MKYDFCEFKNGLKGKPGELYFYGDIVSDSWNRWMYEDQYPDNVRRLLNEMDGGDIDIRINSGGGDVFGGMAIYNMLRGYSGKKTVYVDGVAASIASVIAMAGDKIVMPSGSFLMIHNAATVVCGNAKELREVADVLDKLNAGIRSVYMQHASDGVQEQKLSGLMDAETWLNPTEAAELFACVQPEAGLSAAASLSSRFAGGWQNMPEDVQRRTAADIKRPKAAAVPEELEKYKRYAAVIRKAVGI